MALSEQQLKEKKARLAELEGKIDSTQLFDVIAQRGATLANLVWTGIVISRCLKSPAEPLKKIVLGALAVFKPWTVWVARALSLDVGTTLDDTLLLAAGIAFGLSLVEAWAHAHFEALNDEADDLYIEVHEKDAGRDGRGEEKDGE